MYKKYRISYDLHYRNDVLDYREDMKALNDKQVVEKAKKFIEKINAERAEKTRREMLPRCPEAAQFTKETLLHSNYFVLTGVSRVTETLTTVEVKKEDLQPIRIS